MDYHILTQAKNKARAQVIFHIPIPSNGGNKAGLTWRQAVVASLGGSDEIHSCLVDITPEELTKLKSGELFELNKSVQFKNVSKSHLSGLVILGM